MVNSFSGKVRNYNEDKVAIIQNASQKNFTTQKWPVVNFFGVYDGHGGHFCGDFLK